MLAGMPRYPFVAASAQSLSNRVYGTLVDEAKNRPGPVHALNVGDTYLDPLPAARVEEQRSAEHPRLHNYSPVQGEPVLLDAIVARMKRMRGIALERQSIQVMLGATAGIAVVCNALFEPGDEVVILAPFWPLIRGLVCSRGAKAVEVPFFDRLDASGFDPEAALEAAIGPRTVALYVNSPNNPTGRILPGPVVDVIARAAGRHGLWLLADEAYEDLSYTPQRPEPIWARPELRERTIVCHTLSKSHGLAAARVGYTHGPSEIMRTVRGVQTFLTYCASRPHQLGAARALDEGDAWVDNARRLYAEAGRRAAGTLGLRPPDGGTFLFFDSTPHLQPGEDVHGFLRRCLDVGVLLTPGGASGSAVCAVGADVLHGRATGRARRCAAAAPERAQNDVFNDLLSRACRDRQGTVCLPRTRTPLAMCLWGGRRSLFLFVRRSNHRPGSTWQASSCRSPTLTTAAPLAGPAQRATSDHALASRPPRWSAIAMSSANRHARALPQRTSAMPWRPSAKRGSRASSSDSHAQGSISTRACQASGSAPGLHAGSSAVVTVAQPESRTTGPARAELRSTVATPTVSGAGPSITSTPSVPSSRRPRVKGRREGSWGAHPSSTGIRTGPWPLSSRVSRVDDPPPSTIARPSGARTPAVPARVRWSWRRSGRSGPTARTVARPASTSNSAGPAISSSAGSSDEPTSGTLWSGTKLGSVTSTCRVTWLNGTRNVRARVARTAAATFGAFLVAGFAEDTAEACTGTAAAGSIGAAFVREATSSVAPQGVVTEACDGVVASGSGARCGAHTSLGRGGAGSKSR